MLGIMLVLHVLSAVIWVGGMFFAYMALRPVVAEVLEPPQRIALWVGVFSRFFPWVWLCVLLLLLTGHWMFFVSFGGFAAISGSVLLMMAIGWFMVLVFAVVVFGPFAHMKKALVERDFPQAAAHLASIRRLIAVNLSLGLLQVVIGAGGKYWF
jgi:uncharacterized membrane protein